MVGRRFFQRFFHRKTKAVKPENEDASGSPKEGWIDHVDQCDIIVGIDFGTTFSGCSYARRVDERNNLPTIKPIQKNWPKQEHINFEKAPTNIIYDRRSRSTTKKWGQVAKIADLNRHDVLLGYFKLFLSPTNVKKQYGMKNDEIRQITEEFAMDGTIVVEVIGNYLSLFKDHVEQHIKGAENNNRLTFFYVLTIPAMWDARAKELMIQAAIHGGFVKNNQRQNLLMITEPEAAALSCEMYYKDYNKGGAVNFIVCDAGGGTVDLVTFCLEKGADGVEVIYQIGDGEGDTCGSTYLDDKFKEYLLNFYRLIGIDMPNYSADLNLPMETFINKLKPEFEPSDGNDSYVTVTLGKPIPGCYNTNGRVVKGKLLKISRKDMKEKIFDPIIGRVETLIENQISKMTDGKIDVIVLVGGFSRNSYLRQRLTRTFRSIRIVIPNNAVTAISEGAVSYAQRPRMILN